MNNANVKEEIIKMLESADDRALKLIYHHIKALLGM